LTTNKIANGPQCKLCKCKAAPQSQASSHNRKILNTIQNQTQNAPAEPSIVLVGRPAAVHIVVGQQYIAGIVKAPEEILALQ
jgi:hypothetical protein